MQTQIVNPQHQIINPPQQNSNSRTIWDTFYSSSPAQYSNINPISTSSDRLFARPADSSSSYLLGNHRNHNRNQQVMNNFDRKPVRDMTGVRNEFADQHEKPDFRVQVQAEGREGENKQQQQIHMKAPKAESVIAMPRLQSTTTEQRCGQEEEEETRHLEKSRQVEQMQEQQSSSDDEESEYEQELESEKSESQSPLNSSTLSSKVTANQSAHHSLVKKVLFHFHTLSSKFSRNSKANKEEKERKRRIKRKEKEAKKSCAKQNKNKKPEKLERQESENDRLENIMQRITLYSAFAIVCFLIVLVVGKIVAQNDADSKRANLQHTQQVIQPVAKLDLTKYDHLRQSKNPVTSERLEDSVKNSRLRDSNKRLLTAGSSSGSGNELRSSYTETSSSSSSSSSTARLSLMDKFRQGLDSWIVPRGPGFGFTSQKKTSTTPKPDGREKEWDDLVAEENPQKPQKPVKPGKIFRSPPQSAPYEEGVTAGQPEAPPKETPQKVTNPCANCVKESYLAHYYHKGCKPVRSRECDCVKFFRCPRKPPQPKLTKEDSVKASAEKDKTCVYGGKVYGLNERIPNPDEPCRMCRCRKRQFFNGTITKTYGEVDCSMFVECPEMVFGVKPKRDQCHFAYRHDQCCGTEVCTDELPREDIRVRTTCAYKNKVYKFGEMIYPDENSCMKCICDEGWNEHDPAASSGCKARQCSAFLQENILQKCTPIYRIDGCCPIDFMCPEKRKLYDRDEEDQPEKESTLDEPLTSSDEGYNIQASQAVPTKCTHDGASYLIGTKLYVDRRETQHGRTCARCECKVPPLLTCQADFRCTGP